MVERRKRDGGNGRSRGQEVDRGYVGENAGGEEAEIEGIGFPSFGVLVLLLR